ncbi:MAG TPA: glycosyltransferase family 4 protein [Thermoleophilaceae bacterium]|jgi:glycosyltransferase involved in cell wall biosynthesis|nr:glycosyltransferase family 4 protein [Thermoleophilaceae bacterium]
MQRAPDRPHVLLVCPGLEHARRGFESFARECFSALRGADGVHIELVKGSGAVGTGEHRVRTLRRDAPIARALGRACGAPAFLFEQLEFALALQPLLLRLDPDVVYLSEWHTGRALSLIRTLTGRRFKLLLCNGTMAIERFEHLDCVQELTPAALDVVLQRGADPARQVLLPLGFELRSEFAPPAPEERHALRERLRLPADRSVVLSVAALNRHHKRLDYLIEEVARLDPRERPFLLMAGQEDEETAAIRALANERLGGDGYSIRTVPLAEVPGLYRASDAFVLASLGEGLPRALIEALAYGLPCLAHDYPVARYALSEHGRYGDFTQAGELSSLITTVVREPGGGAAAAARHRSAYERFSWDTLRANYVELLRSVAGGAS